MAGKAKKKNEQSRMSFLGGIKAHAPLLVFAGLYCIFALNLTAASLKTIIIDRLPAYLILITSFVAAVFVLRSIYIFLKMVFKIRPENPLKYWIGEIVSFFAIDKRAMYGLPLLLGFYIFIGAFSAFKSEITVFQPFYYDKDFHDLDVWLHFGRMPWEWLHGFFSQPIWSVIINFNYHLWFFVLFSSIFLACFSCSNPTLGIRYLIASMLLWSVAGNALATYFSSAGPCYYGFLDLGDNPYAGLMERLNDISETYSPILALNVQNLLWEEYQSNTSYMTGGITAFPSMHVASSLLIALVAFSINRILGWVMIVFTLLILIGSVHLGWHYAVDGYVSIFLTIIAWWASKPIATWYVKRAQFKNLYN